MYTAKVFAISVAFILSLVGHAARKECPKLPVNCSCSRNDDDEVDGLECRGTSHSVLRKIFNESVNYELENLKIARSRFPEISSELFRGMTVHRLEIKFSQIKKFYLFKALDSFTKITNFILDHVEIETLMCTPVEDESRLNEIRTFELIDCPEENEIHKQILCHLTKNLTDIKIKWCRLTSKDFSFQRFPGLSELDVSNNLVTEVKRDFFPRPAEWLKAIDMSKNHITSLPDDLFVDMPKLKTINLQSTKITAFPYNVFKPVLNQLRSLEFEYTPFICDCYITWMLPELGVWRQQNLRCTSEYMYYVSLYNALPLDLCPPKGRKFPEILKEHCNPINKSSTDN